MDNKDIIEEIISTGFSLSKINRAVFSTLEKNLNGKTDVVSASNPFCFALEMAGTLASAAMIRHERSLTKPYKALAANWDDLYRHMSDDEYIGIFAGYGVGSFLVYLDYNEVLLKAVQIEDMQSRKLIIPRYTRITIADTDFMTLYPIEIRVSSHNDVQVVYDASVQSDILPLETNVVEHRAAIFENRKFLVMRLAMQQLSRKSYWDTLNPSSGFKQTYTISDNFFYCEVFGYGKEGTEAIKLRTTHSEEIYDVRHPTAVVRNTEGGVKVEIPQIYFTNKMLPGKIKVVIYTTKGEIDINFGDYQANSFALEWGDDFNNKGDDVYFSPFGSWSSMGVAGDGRAVGGHAGMDFEQVRKIVVDGGSKDKLPITEARLRSKLEMRGYNLILSQDNLMRRVYLATRNLPTVKESGFSSGAGCMIQTLQDSMEELAKLSTTRVNKSRLTILPATLFNEVDGVVKAVTDAMNPNNQGLSPDGLANAINTGNYLWTPFQYVLDANDNRFSCRAYYMDEPKVESRTFIAENETLQVSVTSDQYVLEKRGDNYVLGVKTKSSESYKALEQKQLFAQICFVPYKEHNRVWINGELTKIVDGEAYWEFVIETHADIDENGMLQVNNFTMTEDQSFIYGCGLTQKFDLLFGVLNVENEQFRKSSLDGLIGKHLLEGVPRAVTHETYTVHFGEPLRTLWSNGRAVAGTETYLTYPEDVPYVWEDTEYEIDPATQHPRIGYENGQITYAVVHRAGDPVIENGQPKIRHYKGDTVLGADGRPVVTNPRKTKRQVDLFFVDGVYYFATSARDVDYRNSIGRTVYEYIRNDIRMIEPVLHEKTEIFFYPKKTLGRNKVIIGGGIETEIPAALSFNVRFLLNSINYADIGLRGSMEKTASEVINKMLLRETVTKTDISAEIKRLLGSNVIDVELDDLGAGDTINAFTSASDANRCAVKRIVKILPDGVMLVKEDISFDYIRHTA